MHVLKSAYYTLINEVEKQNIYLSKKNRNKNKLKKGKDCFSLEELKIMSFLGIC